MVSEDGTALHWVRPPQQVRSQATLDRILDAAARLVAEKGYEDSSVAEIVRLADSSVGAFYARFEDKHALLLALSARFVEQAMATADMALTPVRWEGASAHRVLHAVVRFLVSVYRDQAGLIRAFVIRNYSDLEFRERQNRLSVYIHARVTELLLARVDEIKAADPERAIRFGLTMVFSTLESVMLFEEHQSGGLVLSDDDFATELTRAYLAYLGVVEPTD